MKKLNLFFLLVFFSTTYSYSDTLRVTIVLDLSKRILVDGQIERDIQIVEHLLDEFEVRQRDKFRFVKSFDRFQILVAPQDRGGSSDLITEELSIIMNKGDSPLSLSAPKFREEKKKLLDELNNIYSHAIRRAEDEGTSGADLWTIIKNDINQVQSDEIDKVFIITDGYFDFDSDILSSKAIGTFIDHSNLSRLRNNRDWQTAISHPDFKLIPVNLSKVDKIVVVELNPYSQSSVYNEVDILKWIWSDWLESCSIKDYQLLQKTTFLTNNLPTIH